MQIVGGFDFFLHTKTTSRYTGYAPSWRQNKAVNNRRDGRLRHAAGVIIGVDRRERELASAEDGRLLTAAAP